jgi:hypothetical protein
MRDGMDTPGVSGFLSLFCPHRDKKHFNFERFHSSIIVPATRLEECSAPVSG